MFITRASGILLHPTSLPSRFGIGDLGSGAYQFVDFLVESFQQVWQILPLGPTGFADSPYLCYSALAGNPLLISPEKLYEENLLSQEDLDNYPELPQYWVDYDLVKEHKLPLLYKAIENFKQGATPEQKAAFEQFCQRHAAWLDDYTLFMAIKEDQDGAGWYQWEEKLAKRDPQTLADYTNKLSNAIFQHKFLQFEFFRQWTNLKEYANEQGIKLFGDIPIYVAHDSVDVWANPDIFCLDEETGEPALMAGVPPDYFSETGQLWGNPVYNWEALQKTKFKWWIQRVEGILEYVDLIRIDHFRGFEAYWAVPQGEETAINGEWLTAPGEEFFDLLAQDLGKLPIIAEDLGVITPEVEALRDKYEFPGMKILQFAFDSDRANCFLPYNYVNRNCIVYTGTHDNDTTVGWFYARSPEEQKRVTDYLGCVCEEGIHWSLIRMALASVANQAIFPLQDVLGFGSDCRMNVPGIAENNWKWRYVPENINSDLANTLKWLTFMYGRAPHGKWV